jgi:16S rRNA G966 N2-methylase RsmD
MNKNILDKDVQNYINQNLNSDVNKIALSKSSFANVSVAELANQITAKKKSEKKLPTWFNQQNIYFPFSLSIEQTSSEITAKYKSNLAKGETLIDITGGFGVDTYYFSKTLKEITHCEINTDLSAISAYNGELLKENNVNFINFDGLEYLKTTDKKFDTIYVDPARRAEKGKVFMLKDCNPDVVSNLDFLLSKSERIIIKTAPLLDIKAGLSELKNVSEIHIVSVKNECKEILWIIDREKTIELKIFAITLNGIQKQFSFIPSEENSNNITYTNEIHANTYLYEPDVALLKSGAFNLIANHYKLSKLHPQSQLYTSTNINDNFPGRIFQIREVLSTADLKKLKDLKGNIIVRNYPAKAEDLVKKYKIKPSNDDFLIFSKIATGENLIFKATIKQYY